MIIGITQLMEQSLLLIIHLGFFIKVTLLSIPCMVWDIVVHFLVVVSRVQNYLYSEESDFMSEVEKMTRVVHCVTIDKWGKDV